jgi:tetratricopeptide (TPR) repeat protein
VSETNWLPGIAVLVLALAAAAGFVFTLRRKREAPTTQLEGIADLEDRARRLLDQLRELNLDRHQLTDEQFAHEKQRLETAAAAALRQKDELVAKGSSKARAKPQPAKPTPPGVLSRHPQLKGALWGSGVVLFFVAIGLFLTQEQKPRTEGREMTGKVPGGSEAAREESPELKAALARMQQRPNDPDAAVAVAHQLINEQDWSQASQLTERAAGLDPFHTENRIHRAFLKAVQGNNQQALSELEHLFETYPDAYEALLFHGAVALQAGNPRGALASFERYAIEAPTNQQPPMLQQGIAMLRKQLGL